MAIAETCNGATNIYVSAMNGSQVLVHRHAEDADTIKLSRVFELDGARDGARSELYAVQTIGRRLAVTRLRTRDAAPDLRQAFLEAGLDAPAISPDDVKGKMSRFISSLMANNKG